MGSLLAAVVGALAAMVFTSVREALQKRRRRRNVASALILEFRVLQRKLGSDLRAAEQSAVVIFDNPISESLYTALIGELPDLGTAAFLRIRSAYAQLRQVNYLRSRLEHRHQVAQPGQPDNLFEAYIASCSQAVTRLSEAIEALESRAAAGSTSTELPPITDLSEAERQLGHI